MRWAGGWTGNGAKREALNAEDHSAVELIDEGGEAEGVGGEIGP